MPRDMARSLGWDDPAVPTKWCHPKLVGPCKISSSYCLPATRRSCCLNLNPIWMWATNGAGARLCLAFYGQTEPESSLLKASFPTIEAHAIRWRQQHYSIGKVLDQSSHTCWSKVPMGCLQMVCQSRALSMHMVPFGDMASTSSGDGCACNTRFPHFAFCGVCEVAPGSGGIRSHRGATNVSGHLMLAASCECHCRASTASERSGTWMINS